ncbi:alpha-(1,3)-fucosyltransferase C-like [Bicyclus anynana]|uniref:Fucosyltransferase n=1 Tax=Bicyclus anynana TaxID=110368 RepID=A0A6J1NQB9_BICAN|nr:alpha-(1,3)-fucosyltransferase C-like [Bicyclus anynana]
MGQSNLLECQKERLSTDLKYILIWKPARASKKKVPFLKHTELPDGQRVFIRQKCNYINCYITHDKDILKGNNQRLDAVVFNVRDIVKSQPKNIDLQRSPEQKYVFHSLDSSEKYPVCDSFFDNFFNWTWTYKLDSDIPQPLMNIYNDKKEWIGPKFNMSWLPKMIRRDQFNKKSFSKTKAVAWLIPRCKTKAKYQDFISEFRRELKTYNYTLDTYGPCGSKKCPNGSIPKCLGLIEKKYFFQLVLEDTFAEDYVSERMVQALSYIVVPIVLGMSDYTNFLPPGSFVNAQSFDIKKLGSIVDYLIHNPSTYYYFFDWKNHYYYTSRPRSQICELCTKLNENFTTSSPSMYRKFRKWWNPDFRDSCQEMSVNNILFKND